MRSNYMAHFEASKQTLLFHPSYEAPSTLRQNVHFKVCFHTTFELRIVLFM